MGCLLVLTVLSLIVVACGDRPDAYGVVLWSDADGEPETGAIVPIVETSRAGDTHLLNLDASNDEIDSWRVRLFDDREAAETFQAEYQEFEDIFARANVNALPVRQRQDRLSSIVYRLRDGEEMKVLRKSAEPFNEAGLVAHWYHVLTEEGVEGYVFGYHLTVFDAEVGIVEEEPEADPVLQEFLSKTWRPVYFAEMLESGTFDLGLFTPAIGFFPEPEQNRFRLVLPKYSQNFVYDEIVKVAPRRYMAEGTSLQFIVRSENVAALQYTRGDGPVSLALQTIEADIEEAIEQERERRRNLYEAFLEVGILHSSAYGTIEFFQNQEFEWRDYDRLVPNAIPQRAQGSGLVAFDHYAGREFQDSYEGVITFRFDGAPNSPVRFLYAHSNGGVRMQFVPETDIRDNVVVRESLSPVVIFFSEPGQG